MNRSKFLHLITATVFSVTACQPTDKKKSEPKLNPKDTSKTKDVPHASNIFSSVEELKESDPQNINANYALVLGYYEPGDRGGGIFTWEKGKTGDTNNGTILKSQASNNGTWKRLINEKPTVFSFGAKAEKGFDSTSAFQNMADALGYVSIPETKIPFELTSFQTNRRTDIYAAGEKALLKIRKNNSGEAAINITKSDSHIREGILIDANFTSRTCVRVEADNCSCDFTAKNLRANANSSKSVSALSVIGDHCKFNIEGYNFKNTGNPNKSIPRLVTVQGKSDNYKGSLSGHDLQCGLTIGSRTAMGNIQDIKIKNANDNGVYQLGGRCRFDTVIYEGNEEGFVAGGEATVNRLIVNRSGSSPISLNNNESLHIKSLQLDPQGTSGFRCLIRTRSHKKGGKIKIESAEGTVKGGVLIGMGTNGGAVESLEIDRANLTYEYDPKTSAQLSRWVDMEAVKNFDLQNISVQILDIKNKLSAKDTFYIRLPKSGLNKISTLKDTNINILRADGHSPSPAHCKIANARQPKIKLKDVNY